jgi:hypothetical protein
MNEAIYAIETRLSYIDLSYADAEAIKDLKNALHYIIVGIDVGMDAELIDSEKGKKDIAYAQKVLADYEGGAS